MGDAYLLPAIAAVVLGGASIMGGRGGYLGTVAGVDSDHAPAIDPVGGADARRRAPDHLRRRHHRHAASLRPRAQGAVAAPSSAPGDEDHAAGIDIQGAFPGLARGVGTGGERFEEASLRERSREGPSPFARRRRAAARRRQGSGLRGAVRLGADGEQASQVVDQPSPGAADLGARIRMTWTRNWNGSCSASSSAFSRPAAIWSRTICSGMLHQPKPASRNSSRVERSAKRQM